MDRPRSSRRARDRIRFRVARRQRRPRLARRVARACRCPETTSLFFTPRRPGVPGAPPTPQDGHQADPPEEFSDADYWEKPPTCPRCRERYRPIQFDDRYVFVLPASLARGDVLRGESVAGGSPAFVVVGSPTGLKAPKALLERFFALQNEGNDVTLAEAQRDLRKRPPVVPKRSRPSQPSPSGSFPAWPVILAILVISNLLRNCSQNDSHWRTPTPQSTPSKLELPELPPYPQFSPQQRPQAHLVRSGGAAQLDGSGLRFPAEIVGIAPAGERSAGEGAARGGVRRLKAGVDRSK